MSHIASRALRPASTENKGLTYADAGVSIDAGNSLVQRIKPFVRRTQRVGSDAEIGGFGGIFDIKATGYQDPVLVSGTDGVGTKLHVAVEAGIHGTVGRFLQMQPRFREVNRVFLKGLIWLRCRSMILSYKERNLSTSLTTLLVDIWTSNKLPL